MDHYSKTGEVAFRTFGLAVENETDLELMMCATKDPQEEDAAKYYVTVILPYPLPEGFIWAFNNRHLWVPVMLQLSKTQEGCPSLYVDIPTNDPIWEKLGVHSFSDISAPVSKCLVDASLPLISIFSEIQRKAFNTRSKIEKLRKKAEKEEQQTPQGQAEKKQSFKHVIKLSGDITYSIVADTEQHRQYRRYCEAWEVRGHYRHYKSGKVSYVKPHVKGQGKLKTKTYSLEGEII